MSEDTKFSQQLAFFNRGMTDMELTDTMRELVQAINTHQKGGKLTLTLTFKPKIHQGEVKYIDITPVVDVTQPKAEPMRQTLFPTYDGDLLRDDPEQLPLEGVRRVDTPEEQEPRKVE